jgi:hypothetical protein
MDQMLEKILALMEKQLKMKGIYQVSLVDFCMRYLVIHFELFGSLVMIVRLLGKEMDFGIRKKWLEQG